MLGGALWFAGGVERDPLTDLLSERVNASIDKFTAGVVPRPGSVLQSADEGSGLQRTPARAIPDPRSVELAAGVCAVRLLLAVLVPVGSLAVLLAVLIATCSEAIDPWARARHRRPRPRPRTPGTDDPCRTRRRPHRGLPDRGHIRAETGSFGSASDAIVPGLLP